jgi:hypothetical protein
LLESFETQEAADKFMKNKYVLFYADELENAEEDVIINPEDMFIEEELPFFEPYKNTLLPVVASADNIHDDNFFLPS